MRPALFPLLALLAPLVFTAPAAAQPVQPLDRLLPEIRRTHPGQFYDADGPHPGASGPHYHLKWMTPDGRIIWYDTDARTGRVLGASPGRDNFDPRDYHDGSGHDGGGRYGARAYPPPAEGPQGRFREGPSPREFGGGYGAWGGRAFGPRGGGHDFGARGFGGYGARGGYDRGGGHRGH